MNRNQLEVLIGGLVIAALCILVTYVTIHKLKEPTQVDQINILVTCDGEGNVVVLDKTNEKLLSKTPDESCR